LCCVALCCVALCCVVLLCVVLCLPHKGRGTALGSVCFFSAPDSALFRAVLKDG
jgi:hypothetical protein